MQLEVLAVSYSTFNILPSANIKVHERNIGFRNAYSHGSKQKIIGCKRVLSEILQPSRHIICVNLCQRRCGVMTCDILKFGGARGLKFGLILNLCFFFEQANM